MKICPLCLKLQTLQDIKGPDNRKFDHCENCNLIFASTRTPLTKEQEAKLYHNNKNSIQDKTFVKLLKRAIDPAMELIPQGAEGLDYGCGPVPTVCQILEEKGLSCTNYDAEFFPEANLDKKFDFIFCTQSFERFFFPAKEISKIAALLADNGLLIILTERWEVVGKFRTWHYAKNPIHVAFYHNKTFNYIAEKYGFNRIAVPDNKVVILQKPAAAVVEEAAVAQEEAPATTE